MDEYLTNDLQLAAFLTTIGHEPCRVEGPPDRRCFVFAGVPGNDISAYHRSTQLVAPVALFTAYRRLKRVLFPQ